HPGVWEMTRAADGRATFEYGDESRGRAARHLPADRHSRRLPAAVITALRRNLMYPFGPAGGAEPFGGCPCRSRIVRILRTSVSGASRTRTGDLLGAIHQISHAPTLQKVAISRIFSASERCRGCGE